MTHETIHESAIAVTLSSGVGVLIRTLTPVAIQRLILHSQTLFPMPDKTAYEKPMENALPGTTARIPAEDNPAYTEAVQDVLQARARWIVDAVLDIIVVGAENEDEIVARYAPQVEKQRKHDVLVEEEGDTPFVIVLRNYLLHDARDVNLILEVAQLHAPLTAPEVAAGRALFRLDTERQTRRTSPLRTIAPRLERNAPRIAEPSSDRASSSA